MAGSPTERAAAPLSVADVERLLRAMDGNLRLIATTRTDDSGAFPALAFEGHTSTPPTDLAPYVGLVLVYPTTADRVAMQPYFGWSGMSGPNASITVDGIVHSEWVGVENVLVEAVMPGGTMGGMTPTPDEADYPRQVRRALEAPS